MKHLFKVAVGFWVACYAVCAQVPLPGGLPAGFPHALLDVLGSRPSFYGKAQIQVASAAETNFDCNVAVLAGNMRLEVSSFQGASNLPSADAVQLGQMHTITLLRPDRNRMYVIYPMFSSYLELPFGPNKGSDPVSLPTVIKTALTNETVDDHPCEQSRWSVTEADGEHYDLSVWMATDYGNFPIQIKLTSPPTVVKFQDVQLQPPDVNLFEPPAQYAKYEGIQELILKTAARMQTNSP